MQPQQGERDRFVDLAVHGAPLDLEHHVPLPEHAIRGSVRQHRADEQAAGLDAARGLEIGGDARGHAVTPRHGPPGDAEVGRVEHDLAARRCARKGSRYDQGRTRVRTSRPS